MGKMAWVLAALASRVWAEIRPYAMDSIIEIRAADVLAQDYQTVADRYLSKRQEVDPDSEVPLNENGGMDLNAWDSETATACREALARLDSASNPSGVGVCYNLPSLDTRTGIFEADLRLFKVSQASGPFTGIPAQDIRVSLSFTGASASDVDASRIAGGGRQGETAEKRQATTEEMPQLLQTYMFVGRIDEEEMQGTMSMAQLEALVMPVLTLSATNSTGDQVRTTVSFNEAAFLTGVFSKEVVMSDFAIAQAVSSNVTAQLEQKEVAFVLPGVQIMIFPIGLIITSVWLVLGLCAYGYGTYERICYAQSFKRRKALAGGGKGTI